MTRSQLQDDVEHRIARGSDIAFDSNLRLAEAELSRRLRLVRQERTIRLSCTENPTALPPLFLEARSVSFLGGTDRLEFVAFDDVGRLNQLGLPYGGSTYYSIQGFSDDYGVEYAGDVNDPLSKDEKEEEMPGDDTKVAVGLYLYPTPVLQTPTIVNFTYVQRFKPLKGSDDTNVLLHYHYDAYMWGVLKHVYAFLEDIEQTNWADLQLEKSIMDINKEDKLARAALAFRLASNNINVDIL